MDNHEWSDHEFPYGAFDADLYAALPPLDTPMKKSSEWTNEENEIFEYALGDAAAVDPSDPTFFENVAKKLPWKTVEDVKRHYEALVCDVEMIEAGNVPVPDYPPLVAEMEREEAKGKNAVMEDYYDDDGYDYDEEEVEVKGKGKKRVTKRGKQRRKGTPWTEEEHQLFLMGLNKYGKGDWRSISRYYVIKKTPTQVASHAQKFFRRRNSCTPPDRRRPSIHDVQTVNPPFTAAQPPILPPFNPPPPVINLVRHTVGPFDRAAVAAVFGQDHMYMPPMPPPLNAPPGFRRFPPVFNHGPPPPPPPPGFPMNPFWD